MMNGYKTNTPRPSDKTKYRKPWADWIGPDKEIEIQGIQITGGMFYVGTEPFAIDTSLPIAVRSDAIRDNSQSLIGLSYHSLSEQNRAAYLKWLANARKSPSDLPFGLVHLYFHGLEYRLFVGDDRSDYLAFAITELSQLYRFEMRRLPWAKLLHCLTWFSAPEEHCDCMGALFEADSLGQDIGEVRLALDSLAKLDIPVGGEMGFEIAVRHPNGHHLTRRCYRNESAKQKFLARFTEQFPRGICLLPARNNIEYQYDPKCHYLQERKSKCRWNVPDVMDANSVSLEKLVEIWNGVVGDCLFPQRQLPQLFDQGKVAELRKETEAIQAALAHRTQDRQEPSAREKSHLNHSNLSNRALDTRICFPVVHELVRQPHWRFEQFEALAKKQAVMPWALYQYINRWTYSSFGDSLLEGRDPIIINQQLSLQMRSITI